MDETAAEQRNWVYPKIDSDFRLWFLDRAHSRSEPHATLEGCVVISSNCSLIVVAAMFCISAAKAREVDLVHFSPFSATTSNEQGAVGAALSTHFEGLVEPADALRISEKTQAIGGNDPSGLFEPNHPAILAPSTSSSCLQNGYRPTWWLSPEVENRRVAYFAAMSAIACENGLPVSLLDAVIAQESGYKAWALSGAGAMGMMQVMPVSRDDQGEKARQSR